MCELRFCKEAARGGVVSWEEREETTLWGGRWRREGCEKRRIN